MSLEYCNAHLDVSLCKVQISGDRQSWPELLHNALFHIYSAYAAYIPGLKIFENLLLENSSRLMLISNKIQSVFIYR